MGFRLKQTRNRQVTYKWQNLWLRYATDMDKKSEKTKGQDSRYYKFERATKHKAGGIRKDSKFDRHKFSKDKIREDRRKKFAAGVHEDKPDAEMEEES